MAELRVHPPLQGASIERLDRPLPGLYVVSLVSDAARCALLLAAGPPRTNPAWALLLYRPRGDAADPHVRGLREKLEGARLVSFVPSRSGWSLVAERGELRWLLEGRRDGVSCSPAPQEGAEASLAPSPEQLAEASSLVPSPEQLAEASSLVPSPEQLAMLRRVRTRLERRVAAVEADLAAAEAAQERARRAGPFAAVAARAPRGASKLEATDWSTGEAQLVTLELDPTRPAREQLDALFAKARRLRAGAPLAEKRRDEATLALWQVDEALPALAAASEVAAIEALIEGLSRELPRDLPLRAPPPPAPRKRASEGPTREPFRRYEGEGKRVIWVGRDAASNDELTVRIARPGDLWLHAKDGTGSHVVVPGAYKKGSPDAAVLVDAATLAAHFSELHGEAIVDVLYADRRHVRKRKGSPRGAVEVQRSKTLALRVEPERLARLLATYRPVEHRSDNHPRLKSGAVNSR
ncbi:MAG: NFACT RNA binding domain-containing protein [Polyangiaceae bacterium]|nr:NFACT RNA binding domain-containing protein [Polyangiaceae bacterium]